MKNHYRILINNNIVEIYKYKENNELHLMTNIGKQYFNVLNKDSEYSNIIIISKNGIWIKEYICTWIGGSVRYSRPFYEENRYLIKNMNIKKMCECNLRITND